MATYAELLTIATTSSGSTLLSQIKVACVIAANQIASEAPTTTNHANRLKWALATMSDPDSSSRKALWSVLAQNAAATAAQITSATDAVVQTAVNAAVDVMAQG